MKIRMFSLGIMLVLAFSLCITEEPEEPTIPPTTAAPTTPTTEAPPETKAETSPPTPAETTPETTAPSTPEKKELVINEEKTKNGIAVTIKKLYYVSEPKYGNSGPSEKHLTVELSIQNTSDSTIEFYPNITSIIRDNAQKEYVVLSMASSKNWGTMGPGNGKEGHITFPAIDENAETITLTLRKDTLVFEFSTEIQNL